MPRNFLTYFSATIFYQKYGKGRNFDVMKVKPAAESNFFKKSIANKLNKCLMKKKVIVSMYLMTFCF